MARVTVEDCVTKVSSRFELVLLAAQRSRDISAGAPLTIDRDNDKNPVVALREIAEETVAVEDLTNAVIQGLQRHVEIDEPEEDEFDTMGAEVAGEIGEASVNEEVREDVLSVQDGPEAVESEAGAASDEDSTGGADEDAQ